MGAPRPDAFGAQPDAEQPPLRRLSWRRLGLLVLLVAAVTAGTFVSVTSASDKAGRRPATWSVPYVDVTLTPTFQFQDPAANPARTVALAFVVADPKNGCAPSWGGYYSLDAAGKALELDRRIAQLRAAGGDVVVSIGGQANQELAVTCQDSADLVAAYRDVVDRYHLSTVDLDIEGSAVADRGAAARRAEALATIQQERAAEGRPLAVWLTLPVLPSGLTTQGVDLVRATLAGGVRLAGVNVMTMDYGAVEPATGSMATAAEQALRATVTQVRALWAAQGTMLSQAQAWARVGATPMIGQNDVAGEVFTLDDARELTSFARANGLGRMSMWSLNRDTPCSASFTDVVVVSATCSGVKQQPLAFAGLFADAASGRPEVRLAEQVPGPTPGAATDDPATSPYPIWRPEGQYPAGYRVVWHGQVYEARWYTTGTDPTLPFTEGTRSPWALVGAVTPTDSPPAPVPTVTGVSTAWDPGTLYHRGDRVLLSGLPYAARWTNRGETPGTLFPVGPDEAWKPLFALPGEPPGS